MLARYRAKFSSATKNKPIDDYDLVDSKLKDIGEIGIYGLEHALADSQVYIQSLYAAHNASDNRGLTFGSLLTSAGSAMYIFTLLPQEAAFPDIMLRAATGLGIALFLCGVGCFVSVWPRKFCLPGSSPDTWLASNWFQPNDFTLKNILIEQLKAIQYQVYQNRRLAKRKAFIQRSSLTIAILFVTAAGFATSYWA